MSMNKWNKTKARRPQWNYFFNRLLEVSVSRFKWDNLPETINPRFLELVLCSYGQAVFFKDENLGYLVLPCTNNGLIDLYAEPVSVTAFSGGATPKGSGYTKNLDVSGIFDIDDNAAKQNKGVMIWNNYLHSVTLPTIEFFADRLSDIAEAIDVNINAQKTPVLIRCDDKTKFSLQRVYSTYTGNEPVIFGDKDNDIKSVFNVISTEAPMVFRDLQSQLKDEWMDCMEYLGIPNQTTNKRERMLAEEVAMSSGATDASRFSPLEMRREFCKRANDIFGLNITVEYTGNYYAKDMSNELGAEDLPDGSIDSDEGGEENVSM